MRRPKHSTATMRRARELHAGGWDSPTQIRRVLDREGVRPLPSVSTIRCWVNETEAAAHRERAAASYRRRSARRPLSSFRFPRTPEAKRNRMEALRDAGLTYGAIAAVMELDFGVALTEETVRYSLTSGSTPRALKEAVA